MASSVCLAFGIASGLQRVPNLVSDPGGLFLLSTTVTLTGGTAFLIWLSEVITVRGIGNGLALILFAGVAAKLPSTVASTVKLTWQGTLSFERVSLLTMLWIALLGLVVFVEDRSTYTAHTHFDFLIVNGVSPAADPLQGSFRPRLDARSI